MQDTTMELWEKMNQLQYLLHRQRFRRREGSPMKDTTRGQGRILAFLKLKDGIRTRDLAYLLDMRLSSLNELLGKLEHNGYIVREPSESDKRVMLIHLTEKGHAQEQSNPDMGHLFRCLSPEEQETFGSYLDRIIATLESQLDETDPRGCAENRRHRKEAFERCFNGEDLWGGRRGRHGGFRNGYGCPRHSDDPHRE